MNYVLSVTLAIRRHLMTDNIFLSEHHAFLCNYTGLSILILQACLAHDATFHNNLSVNIKKDWKLLNIFIGGNDMCEYCRHTTDTGHFFCQDLHIDECRCESDANFTNSFIAKVSYLVFKLNIYTSINKLLVLNMPTRKLILWLYYSCSYRVYTNSDKCSCEEQWGCSRYVTAVADLQTTPRVP
uniref:CVNH domain-containing protein n=1 Tax=Heterorhabditis bacteriophora TaxID=37862 RepID=A0A1I7XC08_HETBA